MIRFVLLLLFGLTVLNGFCQLENIPLITVIGEASESYVSDQIIIKATSKKPLSGAQIPNMRLINVFDAEDSKMRFIENDSQKLTESLVMIKNTKQVELSKEYFVTVNDVSKYSDVLTKLFNLGFDKLVIWDVRLTNLNELKQNLIQKAIADAKIKAEVMTQPLGQTIGKAHLIEVIPQPIVNGYAEYLQVPYDSISIENGDQWLISPARITLLAKVKISFDLNK